MSDRLVSKLLAEFIGTFSFLFIGAGTAAVVGDGVGLPGIVAIALAHGLAITAFAAAYGSVSGGHMNPAVTVGVLAAGATDAAGALAAWPVRCCCGLFWAVPLPRPAHRRLRMTSLLVASPSLSNPLPVS